MGVADDGEKIRKRTSSTPLPHHLRPATSVRKGGGAGAVVSTFWRGAARAAGRWSRARVFSPARVTVNSGGP
jgi:hypothetical protein